MEGVDLCVFHAFTVGSCLVDDGDDELTAGSEDETSTHRPDVGPDESLGLEVEEAVVVVVTLKQFVTGEACRAVA